MDFIHTPYQPGETIAAIATPPGEGGVAIIRISGNNALDIAAEIFSGPVKAYKTHTAHYGRILDRQKQRVDDVLLLVMLGKKSYTGEDTVEVHCHGGSLIARRVLEVVLQAGARAAFPGEFTFKAFLNGKLDLAQAEGVQELISAKNERAVDAAKHQLQGSFSQKIAGFQQALTQIAAILEAWVDFPEEGLEFTTMEVLCTDLSAIATEIEALIATFHDGKILHDGLTLCLIGRPNVGKSSLMNALLDKERAIVSPTPGTTRDVLEDSLRLNGLNLRLLDTAGMRDTEEHIEREGVRRSKEMMSQADLILLVLDAHMGFHSSDQDLLDQIPAGKGIAIWNKIDLPHAPLPALNFPHIVAISAQQKLGLDTLRQTIDSVIWKKGPPSKEEIVITNVRHKEALTAAAEACRSVIGGLQTEISPEFLALDMRNSLSELGKIIGTNITEDILSAIFAKFCIGK